MRKVFLMIPVFMVAVVASAKTVKLNTITLDYKTEVVKSEYPDSIQTQLKDSNMKAKDQALQDAVKKMEDLCIDHYWPSSDQMDVVSIKRESRTRPIKSLTRQ